jgi:CcmD family protein
MMRVMRSVTAVLLAAMLTAPATNAGSAGLQAQAQPSDEFVPVDELPADEELPAAPLVIGAYAVVWLVVLWYLWFLWRRLARVERELADVARRVGSGRP